jgi:hypothetical protein
MVKEISFVDKISGMSEWFAWLEYKGYLIDDINRSYVNIVDKSDKGRVISLPIDFAYDLSILAVQ